MNFKDYYGASINVGPQKRHMHPIGRDVSSHPQSPGKFVPDMHKTVKENPKLKVLKTKDSGRFVLNDKEISDIEKEFPPLKYDPKKPKRIGNTGITLKFDYLLQKPVIEK